MASEYGFSTDGVTFWGRNPSRASAAANGQQAYPRAKKLFTGERLRDGGRTAEVIVDPESIQRVLGDESSPPPKPSEEELEEAASVVKDSLFTKARKEVERRLELEEADTGEVTPVPKKKKGRR